MASRKSRVLGVYLLSAISRLFREYGTFYDCFSDPVPVVLLIFSPKIADTVITVNIFNIYCEAKTMEGVREIDSVLQQVRQLARQFRIPADAAITQQILLFGDSFYGYRFTATGFTAVWSAAEQTLKVHDRNGQMLEMFSFSEKKCA